MKELFACTRSRRKREKHQPVLACSLFSFESITATFSNGFVVNVVNIPHVRCGQRAKSHQDGIKQDSGYFSSIDRKDTQDFLIFGGSFGFVCFILIQEMRRNRHGEEERKNEWRGILQMNWTKVYMIWEWKEANCADVEDFVDRSGMYLDQEKSKASVKRTCCCGIDFLVDFDNPDRFWLSWSTLIILIYSDYPDLFW